MKTAICCIAKCENNYIREWVEYYKNLEFSNVIIYDNNDINGERFEDVIGDYINHGFVIVRDVRGKQSYHQQSYQDCYNEFGHEYDWIAYFDVDEFLELDKKYKNVNEFLSEPFFEKAQVIRVSWKHFDDNDLTCIVDGNYNIRNRFTREANANYIENSWTKGILRGKLPNITISHCVDGAHLINIEQIKYAVNCVGEAVNNNTIRNGRCWENAWLCHYRFKTMEEYVSKKKRGWSVEGYSKEFVNNLFNCDMFFCINQKTQEKVDLYEKLVNN